MAETLASVNVRIGARIDDLQKGLKKAERALIRSGRELSRIGGDLTRSLTLPLGAAGAASLKFASDFETSFLKINTLVGISGDTLEQFKQGIGNLSGPLGQSQAQLSNALFVITSAGQRGADALETLEAASKASAIGLGETEDIARAAVAAVQAYGKENLSSAAAVDKLTAIVRAGNLEASELAPALGKVLPIASQLGVTFDEVGANIATFTRLGVSAPEAVTALKSLLSNLIKPSSQAAEELARVGLSADQLRKSVADNGLASTLNQLITAYNGNVEGISKLFGNVEGLANALGTAGSQGEDYLAIVQEIANSNGIVNDGFEKVAETAQFKMKRAFVELQNVGVQLGGTLIPVVTDLLSAVTPLLSSFSKLSPALQKIIVSTGILVAAAGPAVSVFGNLKVVLGQVGLAYRSLAGGLSIAADTFSSTRTAIAAAGGQVGALTGLTKSATAAWRSFNLVTKASIIGLTVAAIAALVAVMDKLIKNSSTAAQVTRTLNEVNATAAQNIVKERVEAEQLIGVLKDETAAKGDKEAALRRLNAISPEYFRGLSIEKSSVNELNAAYDKYVANLLKAAQAQAAQEKIVDLEKQRLGLVERLNDIKGSGDISVLDAVIFGATGGQGKLRQLGEIGQAIKEIEAQQKALAKVGTEAAIETAKLQNTVAASVGAPLNIDTAAARTNPTKTGSTKFSFGDSFQVNTDSIQQSSLAIQQLTTDTNGFVESLRTAEKVQGIATLRFYEQAEAVQKLQQNMLLASEAGNLIGSALIQAGEAGKTSVKQLLSVVVESAKKFIAAQIAQGVAAQVKTALGAGPLGLFLAPAAAGAAAALFSSLVPKFATGAIVKSPTLAMIGDNPGASSNYEAVLRRDQLQAIAADIAPAGAGGDYLPAFRLDGDTLLVWYERATARKGRRV